MENNNKKIALLVYHVLEPRQVVIKSMAAGLGKINGIAACTVLPDGRVGLILDVAETIKIADGTEKTEVLI